MRHLRAQRDNIILFHTYYTIQLIKSLQYVCPAFFLDCADQHIDTCRTGTHDCNKDGTAPGFPQFLKENHLVLISGILSLTRD